MSKRLFIAGCGYVGTAVAEEALTRGYKVFALTRNSQKIKSLRALGVVAVESDLDSSDWHHEISGDFDLILNTVSAASRETAGYEKSYVSGQKSLLTWMQTRTVGKLIYTSATSIYSQADGVWVSEKDVPTELSPYGKILRQSETLISENADLYKKYFILRLAGIYGPDRHLLLNQLRRGERIFSGDGNRYLNLIHLSDIVSAVWTIVEEEGESGVYNLSDNNPATREEILFWLSQQLKLEKPQFDSEKASLRASGRSVGGKMPNRKISAQKFIRSFGYKYKHPDFKSGYRDVFAELDLTTNDANEFSKRES